MNSSEINIRIDLDDQRVPAHIEWTASEGDRSQPAASKSVFLALLDKETLDTATLFLWTKECQVMEMDRKVFFALRALSDGYYKATQNTELANEMRRFVTWFGEKTGIIPPSEG